MNDVRSSKVQRLQAKQDASAAEQRSLRLGACGSNLAAYSLLTIADPDGSGLFHNFAEAFIKAKSAEPDVGNKDLLAASATLVS